MNQGDEPTHNSLSAQDRDVALAHLAFPPVRPTVRCVFVQQVGLTREVTQKLLLGRQRSLLDLTELASRTSLIAAPEGVLKQQFAPIIPVRQLAEVQ